MACRTASLIGSLLQVSKMRRIIHSEPLQYHHLTILALEGPYRCLRGLLAFCSSVSAETNHYEGVAMSSRVKLGNEGTIGFLHTCPSLFKLIHQTPAFLFLIME